MVEPLYKTLGQVRTPPNFASDVFSLLRANRIRMVVEDFSPVMRVAIVPAPGFSIPLYRDVPSMRSNGTYGEF